VYSSCSLPDIRHRIEQNIQNILPEILKNIKNAFVQKLQHSVTNNRGHFEQLLNKCDELFLFLCIIIFFSLN